MRVARQICCGLDVQKTLIVATIVSTDREGVASYEQRSFGTLNPGLLELRGWFVARGCADACKESTDKY